MPQGPLGGPRPAASCEISIYARFSMGGDVHEEETEPLQNDMRFSDELREDIIRNTGLEPDQVKFHPAGFIVGVQVDTGMDQIGGELANEIGGICQQYLEAKLNAQATPEAPNRQEEWIMVQAK